MLPLQNLQILSGIRAEILLNATISGMPHGRLPKDDLESFVKAVAAVDHYLASRTVRFNAQVYSVPYSLTCKTPRYTMGTSSTAKAQEGCADKLDHIGVFIVVFS